MKCECCGQELPPKCSKCNDTGFLFGAQNWSEKFIKKHGSPYYTADCDCEGWKDKQKQYRDKKGERNESALR